MLTALDIQAGGHCQTLQHYCVVIYNVEGAIDVKPGKAKGVANSNTQPGNHRCQTRSNIKNHLVKNLRQK